MDKANGNPNGGESLQSPLRETKPPTAAQETKPAEIKRRGRPPKVKESKPLSEAKPKGRGKGKRTRIIRPYPAGSFQEASKLAEAIQRVSKGERVRRLTLLQEMGLSDTSSSTRMLITNSGKYSITTGSFLAEWLELTPLGKVASNPDSDPRARKEAEFKLAIDGIAPFKALYEGYKDKKIPTHEVIKDFLSADKKLQIEDFKECIDLFIVNATYLGLIQMVAGAQMLFSVEEVLDRIRKQKVDPNQPLTPSAKSAADGQADIKSQDWAKICFYMTPIGADDSAERKHSDLFLNNIVEPALKDMGLTVIRADKIGEPGMITSQILEYILKARLAIVDLSFHNPNVYYELAIRHACKLAVVHIIRKCDKIPFDVNQARTIPIDTTDIYTLVPQLETFRSQIATFVRQALADSSDVTNPVTVFCPGLKVSLPS